MNPRLPEKRVIVIGASNVTRGLSQLIQQCLLQLGGPIDFMIAAGHGRSLGLSTQVIARRLPAIRDCGIWEALEKREKLPTYAIITDLGNDLPYEVPVAQVLRWFEELMQRLQEINATTVFAAPPMESINNLQAWKFKILLRLLFPMSKLNFDAAIKNARDLAQETKKISKYFSAQIFEPSFDWYGFDPIHIRRSCLGEAWKKCTRLWQDSNAEEIVGRRITPAIPTWRFRPEQMTLFWLNQRRQQPCWTSKLVGTVSLY